LSLTFRKKIPTSNSSDANKCCSAMTRNESDVIYYLVSAHVYIIFMRSFMFMYETRKTLFSVRSRGSGPVRLFARMCAYETHCFLRGRVWSTIVDHVGNDVDGAVVGFINNTVTSKYTYRRHFATRNERDF